MSVKNTKPIILKIKPDRTKTLVKTPRNVNIPIEAPRNLNIPIKAPRNVNIPLNLNGKVIKLASIPLFREDVIFESNGEAFLPGEYRAITIINKLNNLTNNCETIARCVTPNEVLVIKTSENLAQLIGQEAYNTIFYALCSVINQEYRIKGILSLLTVPTPKNVTVVLNPVKIQPKGEHKSCQTYESRLVKKKERRRVRKILTPYVVRPEDVPKKLIIDPFSGSITKPRTEFKAIIENNIAIENTVTPKIEVEESNGDTILPDLGYLQDDTSNDSLKSLLTLNSFKTTPEILHDPISIIEKHIKDTKVPLPKHPFKLMDGTEITLPFKPEDAFHIATKENLDSLNEEHRKKLLLHQMTIDHNHCCSLRDEDGNLPIHLAVIADDLELLKRQCVVLKIRNQSVDITANNGLTALKLSLFRETSACTDILLSHGADPSLVDAEHSACAHLAAELQTDHLSVTLHHCTHNARKIILEHIEELQKPGWQDKGDKELSADLLRYICTMFDKQGYNPLMLASKLGHYTNVRLLLEAVPTSVNEAMPNSGNTALHLAVAAACTLAAERGNKSKVVDHYRKTIETLLDFGADPSIDNCAGCSVNSLLQEFNCAELSMLITNKVINLKYFDGDMDPTRNYDKYHLIRQGNNVTIQEMKSKFPKKYSIAPCSPLKMVSEQVNISVKNTDSSTKGSEITGTNTDTISATKESERVIITVKNTDSNSVLKGSDQMKIASKSNTVSTIKGPEQAKISVSTSTLNASDQIKMPIKSNTVSTFKGSDQLKIIDKKSDSISVLKASDQVKIPVKNTESTISNKKEQASNKPVILEDILLKSVPKSKEVNVNSSYKVETVSSVKKVIWFPLKRKAVNESCNAKKKK